jgi:hypothetical protein
MSQVTIEYKGNKYSFSRDTYDCGYWYPTTGRNAFVSVPVIMSSQLMQEARRQGIDSSLFSGAKTEKERSIRVARPRAIGPKKGKFSVSLSSVMKRIREGQIDVNEPSEE